MRILRELPIKLARTRNCSYSGIILNRGPTLHVRPSVRPSEIIVTRNHFNEEEFAPSMWTWKAGKRFSSLPYYPTFHTFTFPSPSAPSFKNLVLHRYQLAMPCLSRGGYRRICSVCYICQPTVCEISHEMTSYFAQVLFSVCPMAPLLEKSRLCPGHGTPESIISWPCFALVI